MEEDISRQDPYWEREARERREMEVKHEIKMWLSREQDQVKRKIRKLEDPDPELLIENLRLLDEAWESKFVVDDSSFALEEGQVADLEKATLKHIKGLVRFWGEMPSGQKMKASRILENLAEDLGDESERELRLATNWIGKDRKKSM